MVTFHLHYMLKSEFDSYSSPKEAIQADFDQWVQSWLDTYPEDEPATWEQVVANLGRRGPREYTETNIRPGTDLHPLGSSFQRERKDPFRAFGKRFQNIGLERTGGCHCDPQNRRIL